MLARKKNNYNNLNNNKYNNKKDQKNYTNKKKLLAIYVLGIIIFGIILVFLISQTLLINELNFKLSQKEEQLQQIYNNNNNLKLEIARETSLSQVENIARNELNMIEPRNTETLVLNESKEESTDFSQYEKKNFAELIKDLWQTINVVNAGYHEQ